MEYDKLLKKARKLGVSVDTYKFLRSSNCKMRYFTHDIKREKLIVENESITFIPSREDSLERLAEDEGVFFSVAEQSVEDIVIGKVPIEQFYHAMELLEPGERQLIEEVFFSRNGEGKSERDAAESLGVHRMTLHDRKTQIFAKLRKMMETLK